MNDDEISQDKMAEQWAAAMAAEQASEGTTERGARASDEGVKSTQQTGFNRALAADAPDVEIPAPPAYPNAPELDVILDISVRLTMEVGSKEISIGELLQLKQGSVMELDRLAGQALDVLVNGTLIAQGEVVLVNDKYGIRMTDIISQSERIKRLK